MSFFFFLWQKFFSNNVKSDCYVNFEMLLFVYSGRRVLSEVSQGLLFLHCYFSVNVYHRRD